MILQPTCTHTKKERKGHVTSILYHIQDLGMGWSRLKVWGTQTHVFLILHPAQEELLLV